MTDERLYEVVCRAVFFALCAETGTPERACKASSDLKALARAAANAAVAEQEMLRAEAFLRMLSPSAKVTKRD